MGNGPVVVAANIKRESVRIDPSGNEINPRTRQILKPVEPEFVAPVAIEQGVAGIDYPNLPTPNRLQAPTSNPLTILEQIEQAKMNLKQLEELKKLKIAEKEAELELLKQ